MRCNAAKPAPSSASSNNALRQMHPFLRALSALHRGETHSRLPLLHRLAPLTHAAATGSLEGGVSDSEAYIEDFESVRLRDRGYTPFEFIEFTDIPLKHEVSVWVDRPVADCYKVWHNRLNWMQWFTMIDEVGFHEEEPSYMSMYLWYRWATTPFLELYVTLERTQEEDNKYILEEPVEGLPLVAAVLFQEGEDEDTGEIRGTTVTLRLSYLLPKVLHEFAGRVAVYGDVDNKLQACMGRMKAFVESVDLKALEQARAENESEIRANFALQREHKAESVKRREAKAKEWAAAAALSSEERREDSGAVDEPAAEAEAGAGIPGEGGEENKEGARVRHLRAKDGADLGNPAAKRKSRKEIVADTK